LQPGLALLYSHAALARASRELDVASGPVYLWVVDFEPGFAHYQVLFAQIADGEGCAFCVSVNSHNEVDRLLDRSTLVERTIDVVDWYSPREFLRIEGVLAYEFRVDI